jgi:hypothetical protein
MVGAKSLSGRDAKVTDGVADCPPSLFGGCRQVASITPINTKAATIGTLTRQCTGLLWIKARKISPNDSRFATRSLEVNGRVLTASEESVVQNTLALAAGELNEEDYAVWLKANSRTRR